VGDVVLVCCNFTPVPRIAYRVGVPLGGNWKEICNSDAKEYGGSGVGNGGTINAGTQSWHGREYSALVTLPPLAAVAFRYEAAAD
jgi:1,4-alpha-glucan branching enzyme